MRIRGSVIRKTPGEFEAVDLELDGPGDGEVMVQLAASGMCHSDDHLARGDMPVAIYPLCGGHEGSGVVVEVGPGVTHLREGDHVVFAFMPACGRCRWCARGMQNLCDLGSMILAGSRYKDPSSFRLSMDGVPVGQMVGLSTFAEYTTVDAASAVRIPSDVPLAELTLMQKRIQGSLYGGCSPTVDIPLQIELYTLGVLKLDELITTTYSIEDVAQGYRDMHAGTNIRGVVVFDRT